MIPMMNPFSLTGQSGPNSLLWGKNGLFDGTTPKSWTLAGLQGASTYAGTLAQIGAIKANAQRSWQATAQTMRDDELNAAQAQIEGVGKVAGLRQSLAQTLGQRAAIAAASGVDGGQGIVADNANAITANNDAAAGVARTNADIIARRYRINAIASALGSLQNQEAADREVQATRGTGVFSALLGVGGSLLSPVK